MFRKSMFQESLFQKLHHNKLYKTLFADKVSKFFVALGAFVLALTFYSPPAKALIMNFGDIEITLDTTVTAGISIRAVDREDKFLPASNGGPRDISPLVSIGLDLGDPLGRIASDGSNIADIATEINERFGDDLNFVDNTIGTISATTLTTPASRQQLLVAARDVVGANLAGYGNNCGAFDGLTFAAQGNGGVCFVGAEQFNYDDSINTDDGRLNFDNGDLISGTFKITPELNVAVGNWRSFVRLNAFYDVLLDQSSSFERSAPGKQTKSDMVRHVDLLDAYISNDGEFLGTPYTIKVGRQVINWGESTFVLGGNSVFNPIDVGALRRPGSEIKEGFIPVEAVSSTLFLPGNLTLESYYGDWEHYKLDRAGYPFSAADIIGQGGTGANRNSAFISGGFFSGGAKLNCDVHGTRLQKMVETATGTAPAKAAPASAVTQAIYKSVYDAARAGGKTTSGFSAAEILKANNCFVDPATTDDTSPLTPGVAHNIPYTVGKAEAQRKGYDDPFEIKRFGDKDRSYGNWGTAVRWYSELLNSTEFGLYFQNYHSRIPYVNIVSNGPSFGYSTVTPNSSINGRVLFNIGCGTALAVSALPLVSGGLKTLYELKGSAQKAKTNIFVDDPLGLAKFARDVSTTVTGTTPLVTSSPTGKLTLAEAQEMICRSHLANAKSDLGTNALDQTGEMYYGLGFPLEIGFAYPEDLKVFGGSFNTTLFGWGVQGEIAWRPDFPLQVDTDELTISGIISGCGFENYGPAFTAAIPALAATAAAAGDINTVLNSQAAGWRQNRIGCTDDRVEHIGWVEEDVMNWDIGTTATFTRSNPVVRIIGADLAILLTEFAGVWTPQADKYKNAGADVSKNFYPLQNLCTTGTDIALKAVFSLDPRPNGDCRPTMHAMGMVLLGQLQYNNVFGTPFGLTPRLVWSYGLQGRAPIPAAAWREDVGAISLGLDANYLSAWKATFSYVHYLADDDDLYSDNIDRNFVSLSLSYAF